MPNNKKTPPPQNKPQNINDAKFESLCKVLEDAGLESFVLACPPDPEGVIHMRFNGIEMKKAMNVISALFIAGIDTELRNHPEYPKNYVAIFETLKADFADIIRKSNSKVFKFAKDRKYDGKSN